MLELVSIHKPPHNLSRQQSASKHKQQNKNPVQLANNIKSGHNFALNHYDTY